MKILKEKFKPMYGVYGMVAAIIYGGAFQHLVYFWQYILIIILFICVLVLEGVGQDLTTKK